MLGIIIQIIFPVGILTVCILVALSIWRSKIISHEKTVIVSLLSLIISIWINQQNSSFWQFFLLTTLEWGLIASLTLSILAGWTYFRRRQIRQGLFAIFVSLTFIGVLYFIYFLTLSGIAFLAVTPAHYRTNMFTGQCDFGGEYATLSDDPWYYVNSCYSGSGGLSTIRKIIQDQPTLSEECQMACETNDRNRYCNLSGRLHMKEKVTCDEIGYITDFHFKEEGEQPYGYGSNFNQFNPVGTCSTIRCN